MGIMSPWVAPLLSLLGSIIGVLGAKLVDNYISKDKLKKEALCKRTAYRQEWVNALRAELAKFLAITSNHGGTADDYEKYAEELALSVVKIHFYLNPQEEITREIKECMDNIIHPTPMIERKPPMLAKEDLEKFALLAEAILKFEWERIKRELAGQEGETSHSYPKDAMELYNSWIKKPVAGGTASR